MGQSTSNEGRRTTGGNALPKDDPPNVTRFKSPAAKRVQAHRARARMGLRCLTVRVSDREVRRLISKATSPWRAVRRRRQSRSRLRRGLRTISPEPINHPSQHCHVALLPSPAHPRRKRARSRPKLQRLMMPLSLRGKR